MGFYIYLGVLSRLKLGDLEEVSGASAGALLLFLFLATKGDIPAMLDHSVKIPVKQLMKPNIKNFFTKFGLVPTAKLEATIKKTCKKFLKKDDITFRELYEFNPIKFHVSAFCVDLQKTVYFSVDSTPDMSVCQAVTASIAVPFLVSSVRIGEWNYIDGCIDSKFKYTIEWICNVCWRCWYCWCIICWWSYYCYNSIFCKY